MKLAPLDLRPYVWNKATLASRVCPFCGALGFEKLIRPDELTIRFCKKCGTYFVSPAPSEFALSEFYKKYSRIQRPRGSLDKAQAKVIERTSPFSDFRVCEFASMTNLKGKRVLDVGFGTGEMLYRLRQLGAIVEGIDLDIDNVQSVKSLLNLNVYCKTLDEIRGEKYDLIIMHDLIEHLLNPFDLLKKCYLMLNDKGLISIFTPNASFAHREKNPILFRVDLEHLNYITFQTCRYIADSLKMQEIHLESIGFPFLGNIVEQNSGVSKNPIKILRGLARNTPIESCYDFVNRVMLSKKRKINLDRRGSYSLFLILQK